MTKPEWRAWNKKKREMIYDIGIYGDYIIENIRKGKDNAGNSIYIADVNKIGWYELMEYSGEWDKTGKKIYENDILEMDSYSGRVRKVLPDNVWCVESKETGTQRLKYWSRKGRIVGNTWEG